MYYNCNRNCLGGKLMAFFDRFKRKKTASVLPQEVDDYYRAEKRGRRGAAFFLGLMTLVLTILFVLGVFFIGRYFYNKVRDNSSDNTSITTSDANKNTSSEKKSSDDKSQSPASSGSGSGSSTTGSTPAPTPATTTPSVAPNTGDNVPGTALPRTGDEGM